MTTYEEWRVTGDWLGRPREEIFSPKPQPWRRFARGYADPEGAARQVIDSPSPEWTDGPHLHKRTVTVTDWEPA
jgi:hypothetical protein